MRHTINRCYAKTFDNFQRKMTNPINGSYTLKMLLNGNKRVYMRSSNFPYNGEVKWSTSNEKIKALNLNKFK